MKLKDTSNIEPLKDVVLVNVLAEATEVDGVYLGQRNSTPDNVKSYFGEVEKLGPSATSDVNCPGLKQGDIAMFSEFSGHHISTANDKKLKVIPGYDIIAVVTDPTNVNETTMQVTTDRLLISVKMVDETEDGIVLSKEESRDPKLTDLDYGTILQTGPVTKLGMSVGQLVAFEPWCGTIVKSRKFTGDTELKVIREDDILFIAG